MDAGDISLEEFVIGYVSVAFEEASKSPSIAFFDSEVMRRVSEELGLDLKMVRRLHNPFHWAMFQEYHESPVETFQSSRNGDGLIARPRREYTEEDIARLADYIIDKHGDHLLARVSGRPVYEGDVLPTRIPLSTPVPVA